MAAQAAGGRYAGMSTSYMLATPQYRVTAAIAGSSISDRGEMEERSRVGGRAEQARPPEAMHAPTAGRRGSQNEYIEMQNTPPVAASSQILKF
jgi:hypothetical protein